MVLLQGGSGLSRVGGQNLKLNSRTESRTRPVTQLWRHDWSGRHGVNLRNIRWNLLPDFAHFYWVSYKYGCHESTPKSATCFTFSHKSFVAGHPDGWRPPNCLNRSLDQPWDIFQYVNLYFCNLTRQILGTFLAPLPPWFICSLINEPSSVLGTWDTTYRSRGAYLLVETDDRQA